MAEDIKIENLWDLSASLAGAYLARYKYGWEALSGIADFIRELGPTLPADEYKRIADDVWVAHSAKIMPSASISGPCIIGHGTELRHSAFIRGSVLIGANCVVGNSCELKNSILFDHAQAPHFNYVGDSILGHYAHMGAGAITSNVKGDKSPIVVKGRDGNHETGLKKFGALLGDHAEIGCQAVLNPGTVIGARSRVYPLTLVRGVVPADSILKSTDVVVAIEKRENL